MVVRLLEIDGSGRAVGGRPIGTVLDVQLGVALEWIKRKKAVEVKDGEGETVGAPVTTGTVEALVPAPPARGWGKRKGHA